MNQKVFIEKDRLSLKKKVTFFITNSRINTMNVKYDVNYAQKEYRASVLYMQV